MGLKNLPVFLPNHGEPSDGSVIPCRQPVDVDPRGHLPAVVVAADEPLRHVVQLMLDHKIGGIPVVDDQGCALGMVTESDLFRLLIQLWEQTDQAG